MKRLLASLAFFAFTPAIAQDAQAPDALDAGTGQGSLDEALRGVAREGLALRDSC